MYLINYQSSVEYLLIVRDVNHQLFRFELDSATVEPVSCFIIVAFVHSKLILFIVINAEYLLNVIHDC